MRHEKAERLLELARLLGGSAEGLTLDEMAQALGTGRRTVERMRDAVERLFPQMEALPDGPTKRFRIPGGLDGLFQQPSAEELREMERAAEALRAAGAESRAARLDSLGAKVRSAMRNAALRKLAPDLEALVRAETVAVQAGPRPYEDEALIARIREALMAMRTLRFRYRGGSRPGAPREVVPYGLMFGRANYLVAAEPGAAEPRTFRLDRIEDAEATETPGAPPADFDLQAFAYRSFGIYQGEVEEVVLRVMPEAAEEALGWRFHPSQTFEPQRDGGVIVRFQASGMLELAWHLFTWGDKIRVLRPDALKQTLADQLAAALAWHTGAPVQR